MKPALVIPAAGASSRLGTCKALVRLRDLEPATPLALLAAAGACLDGIPLLVVTGADHEAIAAAAPEGCEVLVNSAWREGRTGGIRLAAEHRPGRDLCIAPVDTPLVPAAVFEALLTAWVEADSPGRGWLAPFAPDSPAGERTGHPIVVGRELLSDLAAFEASRSLRDLRAGADPLWRAAVASTAIHDDLDTPSDLAALRLRASAEGR
ncbi:MAG: NTP transferase domain-containing protein [Planctomycetota bacterium]|nr:NTP transferase domain-containing protein [Planctomycetota bacterium]